MDWIDDFLCCFDYTLGGKDMSWKKLAKKKNREAFQNWLSLLVKKALARYNFDGLPETVSERVLKWSLLYWASVCFFEKYGQTMALPAAVSMNGLTVYGDWSGCTVYGRNGYFEDIKLWLPGEDKLPFLRDTNTGTDYVKGQPRGVWFRENEQKFPFFRYCVAYAEELADSWRKITVARKNSAVPFMIICDEQGIPTIKKAINTRDNNEDILVLSSGVFDPSKVVIEPITTTAEAIKAHTDLVEWYLNQFDMLCGMNNNANQDKKERLLVDEVNANNQSTQGNIDDTIRTIHAGLDQVNKHLGTSIKVVKGYAQEQQEDRKQAQELAEEARGGAKDGEE